MVVKTQCEVRGEWDVRGKRQVMTYPERYRQNSFEVSSARGTERRGPLAIRTGSWTFTEAIGARRNAYA